MFLAALYLPYPSDTVEPRILVQGRQRTQGVALWDMVRETITAFTLSDTLDATWRVWLWISLALLALAGLILLFTRDWKRGLFLRSMRACRRWRSLRSTPFVHFISNDTSTASRPSIIFCSPTPLWNCLACSHGASRKTKALPLPRVLSLALLVGSAVLAGLALLNYWTNPAYAKAPDWRGLASIISANAMQDDIIIQNFPETSLVYYDRSKLPLVVYPETYLPDAETDHALNAMNANYQHAWFIPAAPDYWDPAQYVEEWLDRRTDLLHAWNVGDLRLRLYGTTVAVSQYHESVRRGVWRRFAPERLPHIPRWECARVALYWRVLIPPGKSLTMNVRLLNPDQSVAQEITQIPVRGELPTSEWHKNQLIVDQYDFPDSSDATRVSVSVCDAETRVCLPSKRRDAQHCPYSAHPAMSRLPKIFSHGCFALAAARGSSRHLFLAHPHSQSRRPRAISCRGFHRSVLCVSTVTSAGIF